MYIPERLVDTQLIQELVMKSNGGCIFVLQSLATSKKGYSIISADARIHQRIAARSEFILAKIDTTLLEYTLLQYNLSVYKTSSGIHFHEFASTPQGSLSLSLSSSIILLYPKDPPDAI